ncbi:MAG TPA: photosynthetic complex putative assembly protein PuhB [Rhodopseudomonas sp.]|uniref:photosynthetic complex putative assembly protein PuhB n=1 Tax=Rhodopseudomonas sp. TaxID=1078 RepID=UPI002ED8BBB6
MNQDPSQRHELPSSLAEGERVIWQGKPSFKGLAVRSFHIREAGIYVGLFLAWKLWSYWANGMAASDAVGSAVVLLVPCLGGIALLALLAWLFRRATTYTITSKRVLVQFGVALPMSMNIPLSKIANVDLKTHRDGTGDIPLQLADTKRVSYLLLWPHIRPWRTRAPEPMLNSVPEAAQVAAKLAEALAGQPGPSVKSLVQVANSGTSKDPLGNPTAPVAA